MQRAHVVLKVEDNMDYAVFKTGGKQYRVKPGDTLDVELLPNDVDSIAEFEEVLALSDGGEVTCLLYTSPSPRDGLLSRMPSSA